MGGKMSSSRCRWTRRIKGMCLSRSSRSRGRRRIKGFEDVNNDILMEILIRLPLKSIFRSKCVSKRWYRLISEPLFCINFIKRNQRNRIPSFLGFIEFRPCYTGLPGSIWRFIAIPPQPQSQSPSPSAEEERVIIINSMKSLFNKLIFKHCLNYICSSKCLFLCNQNAISPSYRSMRIYYIFNPLSQLFYVLPLTPDQQEAYDQWQAGSAKMKEALYAVGLVVSDKYDTYKVVRGKALLLLQGPEGRPSPTRMVEIQTFSSDTGEWELSTLTVSPQIHNNFIELPKDRHKVIVIKGIIYWIRRMSIITYDPYRSSSSSSSNSNTGGHGHSHGVLNMVTSPPFSIWHACMGESTDGLLQFARLEGLAGAEIEIWVFRSNGNGKGCEQEWSLRYHVASPLPEQDHSRRFLLGFHPHNPNSVFVAINDCVFVCTAAATPATPTTTTTTQGEGVEKLVQLPHGTTEATAVPVVVQPYTLPPWPISPFPLRIPHPSHVPKYPELNELMIFPLKN